MNPFPPIPEISEEERSRCRQLGRVTPVLFKWTRYSAEMVAISFSLRDDFPMFAPRPLKHVIVLRALLYRCYSLLRSIVELAAQNRFAHTISYLSRGVLESATVVSWLVQRSSEEAFLQFIHDGLSTDLRVKEQVLAHIRARGTGRMAIEERMIASIDHCRDLFGVDEAEVRARTRMPRFPDIFQEVYGSSDPYIFAYRNLSHAIHGTSTDLMVNFITGAQPSQLDLAYADPPPDDNVLRLDDLMTIDATRELIRYRCGGSVPGSMQDHLTTVQRKIVETQYWLGEEDFRLR